MDWESSVTDRDLEQEEEAVNKAKAAGAAADQVLVQLGVGAVAPQAAPAAPLAPAGQPTMATLPPNECTSRLGQAQIRIAQANLYRAVLENGFFEPGSGDPALISIVDAELKTFVTERLEVLLGMRSAPERVSSEDQELLQFLKDLGPTGRAALKMLADRITGGTASAAPTTTMAPKALKPAIRRVKAAPGAETPITTAPAPQAEPKPRKKYQKTDNPNRLPMPTLEQEAAKYAVESEHFGKAKGILVTAATEAAAKKPE